MTTPPATHPASYCPDAAHTLQWGLRPGSTTQGWILARQHDDGSSVVATLDGYPHGRTPVLAGEAREWADRILGAAQEWVEQPARSGTYHRHGTVVAAPAAVPPTDRAAEATAEHHVVDGVKYLCHAGDHYCPAEPHRLALSEALGLGTSAPWDAIRERAAELAGQAMAGDDEGDELVCVDECGSCDACGMEPFGTPAEGWREAARFLRSTARASGNRRGALHGARLIETELRRLAAEAPPALCIECGHAYAAHQEGDDPVSPGSCAECPDEEWHDYDGPTDGRPELRLPRHTVNEAEAPDAEADGALRPTPRDRHREAWNALTPQRQAAYLAELDNAGRRQDGTEQAGGPWVAAEAPRTETPAEALCICGHPTRHHCEDACLRTGCGCSDSLEISALPEALEAVLTKRFTELGNPFSEMRRHEQGPDGWPSSRPVGPHQVGEVLRELLAAAPTVTLPGKEA